ncbi:putative histidine kinase [Naviculisporaceae sp. PSN 640]
MAKKKKAASGNEKNANSEMASSTSPPTTATPSNSLTTTKKAAKPIQPAQPQSPPALIICRNKHWRFISSFHGPWLQLPPEILETLANMNYNTPRPRPIDPAVFFDIVKIRRLVDEATNLAVRAASGVASIGQTNASNAPAHHAAYLGLGLGYGSGGQTKLSRERKQKMRESATQKLAKAYQLDEIACSVATMQSASALEEVAAHVLQRNPQDLDALYVHFFHEKIPSRQLAESTDLAPLNTVIASRPSDPEPLRTRGIVRIFKSDFEGAVTDFKWAIDRNRPRAVHAEKQLEAEAHEVQQKTNRRQEDIILKDEDHPSSLNAQLLFQKAGVHLTIACRNVAAAFLPTKPEEEDKPAPMSQAENEGQKKMMEARKLVRLHAKRALRDIMGFLSHFEYSPDLPIQIAEEFTHKATSLANGQRVPRGQVYTPQPGSPVTGSAPSHRIYKLSELFAASPPPGLPPYPNMELTTRAQQPLSAMLQTTTETITFHPLLADSLHSLLLCHCLVQTSAKELLRHAYMVARLARLADGYPVFQASRSPARADWIEILRGGSNWINLAGNWDDLCAPAPIPLFQPGANGSGPVPVSMTRGHPSARQAKLLRAAADDMKLDSSSNALMRSVSGSSSTPNGAAEAERQRQELIHHQAVLDSLNDERVTDESSFRLAIRARKLRAERDYQLDNAVTALDAKLTRGDPEFSSPRVTAAKASENEDFRHVPHTKTPDTESAGEGTNGSAKPAATGNGAQETTGGTSPSTGSTSAASSLADTPAPAPVAHRRTADDAARDYPISTERAMAITRWVLDAPPNAGLETSADGAPRKKKKRPANKSSSRSPSAAAVAALGDLLLGGGVN